MFANTRVPSITFPISGVATVSLTKVLYSETLIRLASLVVTISGVVLLRVALSSAFGKWFFFSIFYF